MTSDSSPRRNGNSLPETSTRAALVAAAREVFELSGYRATIVDQIRRRAGVSRASFYFYFPDKKAVFLEVLREYGSVVAQLRAVIDDVRDDSFTRMVVDQTSVLELWSRYTNTFRGAYALAMVDEQARELMQRFRGDRTALIEAIADAVPRERAFTAARRRLLASLVTGVSTDFVVRFFVQEDECGKSSTTFEDAVLAVAEAGYRMIHGEPAPEPFPIERIRVERARISTFLDDYERARHTAVEAATRSVPPIG